MARVKSRDYAEAYWSTPHKESRRLTPRLRKIAISGWKLGNMGSDQVFDYTAIGDAVNLASRLEGANKRYKTSIMISEFTLNELTPGLFRNRILDVIRVKGKNQAVRVYEVAGDFSEHMEPEQEEYIEAYEKAFHAYLAADFRAARTGFERALTIRPDDPASRDLLERIDRLELESLPEDWNGAIRIGA